MNMMIIAMLKAHQEAYRKWVALLKYANRGDNKAGVEKDAEIAASDEGKEEL